MLENADRNVYTSSLRGKKVVLGVTASISIYRIPDLIRDMRREGADIIVGMSEEAADLVSPKVMEWASGNSVVTNITGKIEHISLFSGERKGTALVIAPCTHNMIGKMANGISDDVPSTFYSFASGNGNPILIAPAMHEGMYSNPANRRNVSFLQTNGVGIVPPDISEEKAKLSANREILDMTCRAFDKDVLDGKRILILGGHTEEPVDHARSISNHSTGFTGYWIARNAFRLGASDITYIGNSSYELPQYVQHVPALTSSEMEEQALKVVNKGYEAVLSPAAISDFEVSEKHGGKLSGSSRHTVELIPREKVIEKIRKEFNGLLVAFSLESELSSEKKSSKFANSRPDLIVSNSFKDGRAFGKVISDYDFISEGRARKLRGVSKPEMTLALMKEVAVMLKARGP